MIEKENEEKFLRVSAGSNAQSVGSAIAHALYEAPRGLDLTCRPGFATVESRDGSISAIVFTITVN